MNGTTVRRSPGRKGTPQAESESKLPRTVAEVLKEHVELEVESIDRMYLNVFVPRLQIVEGALHFIRHQCESKVLSTTAVEPMTRGFVRTIEQYAQDYDIPMVSLRRGSVRTMLQTNAGRNSINRRVLFSSAKLRRSVPSTGPKSDTIPKPTKAMPGL